MIAILDNNLDKIFIVVELFETMEKLSILK